MRIAALDIATTTGICAGEAGATPTWWEVNLGEPPDGRRFSNILRLTQGILEAHRPDLVVVEAAIGGAKASAYLIGLVACVRGCAWNRGVRCEMAHLGSIRKHFLGRALTVKDFPALKPAAAKKAMKAEVVKRCHLLGWKVDTDNEADAVALWDYACAIYGNTQAKPLGGLFA